jgi:hypothetical protein
MSERPKKTDPRYKNPDGSVNEALYEQDLALWNQQAASNVAETGDASGGMSDDEAADAIAGSGDQNTSGPGNPKDPDQIKRGNPDNVTGPAAAAAAAAATPNWWENAGDDTTEDAGAGNFSLGADYKVVADPELQYFDPQAQVELQTAHDARDEAGFNRVKDRERQERLKGGDRYAEGGRFNPNRVADSTIAGIGLDEALQLLSGQGVNTAGYREELSRFAPEPLQEWIADLMRGATDEGTRLVERERKKRQGTAATR